MKYFNKHQVVFALFVVIVALFIAFPLFYQLDKHTIRVWDESRLVCNAVEMLDNQDYLVTHFEGQPDMWNSKPPLFIWIIAAFIKLFGYNELAVRLPSAISGLLTIFLIFYVCKKLTNSKIFGLISGLVLATSGGYVVMHVTRTTDYDSFLTLLCTAWLLLGFWYLRIKQQPILLYFLSLLLALSVLTKSIQALVLLPGLLLFALYTKSLVSVLKSKHTYISAFIAIAIVGAYYIAREFYNPGYLVEVYKNEVGGRYFDSIEGHQYSFWLYFDLLRTWGFEYWIIFVPISIWILIAKRKEIDKNLYDFIIFCLIISFTYLLIISLGQTKCRQYMALSIPFLAIVASFPIWYTIDKYIVKTTSIIDIKGILTIMVLIIVLFDYPYSNIINSITEEDEQSWENEDYGKFMRMCKAFKHYSIVTEGYNASLNFYVTAYQKRSFKIKLKAISDLNVGDTVMICESHFKKGLNALYQYQSLNEWKNSILVRITGKKKYDYQERISFYKSQIISNSNLYNDLMYAKRNDTISAEQIIYQKATDLVKDEMSNLNIKNQ